MSGDQIIKYFKEILANTELQEKNEINRLKAREYEELERIILRNRHLRRPDRDREEEIIGKADELIRKKVNELKNLFTIDNDLIMVG